jgi:hypothetical protein
MFVQASDGRVRGSGGQRSGVRHLDEAIVERAKGVAAIHSTIRENREVRERLRRETTFEQMARGAAVEVGRSG